MQRTKPALCAISPGWGRGEACPNRSIICFLNCSARNWLSFRAQSNDSRSAHGPAAAGMHVTEALTIRMHVLPLVLGRPQLNWLLTQSCSNDEAHPDAAPISNSWLAGHLRISFHFASGVFSLLKQNLNLLHSMAFGWSSFLFAENEKEGQSFVSRSLILFFCQAKWRIFVKIGSQLLSENTQAIQEDCTAEITCDF